MVEVVKNWTVGMDNITTPTEFLMRMNTNLLSLPANLILITMFVVLFLLFKNNSTTSQSFSASSFITAILAWLFWIIGLISTYTLVITIVIAAVSVGVLFMNARNN